MPADLWIATIPFRETRDYVRRVLAYWVFYADRLGMCTAPLSTALSRVASAPDQAQVQAEVH
jgi:soluble lytic murein transglycosylase